jgi:hypothetical protein
MPDPNINFASFVLSLAATAAVHFGDRLEPGAVEPGPVDLVAAQQMIDILALLEEKTRGNLTADERLLSGSRNPPPVRRSAEPAGKKSSRLERHRQGALWERTSRRAVIGCGAACTSTDPRDRWLSLHPIQTGGPSVLVIRRPTCDLSAHARRAPRRRFCSPTTMGSRMGLDDVRRFGAAEGGDSLLRR